jgi:signal peptidase
VGEHLDVEVTGTGGARLSLSGVVASHHRRRGEQVLGVEIVPPDGGTMPDGWFTELVRASRLQESRRGRRPMVAEQRLGRRDRVLRSADRFLVASSAVVSVVALVALVGAVLGFRPLVVRSSSMEPALSAGDLVLVEMVPVSEVRPGDVVSRLVDPGSGDDLTHRVVSARTDADVVSLDTKGDANPSAESWRLPADEPVGRMVVSLPSVGTALTTARALGLLILVAAGLVLLGMLMRSRNDR